MDIDNSDGFEPVANSRLSSGLAVLVFTFGVAAGFLAAFSGLSALGESVYVILLVGVILILLVGVVGLLVFLFRKPILRRVFGFAHTEIERFADPLSRVARAAIDRDPEVATGAAQDLARFALARYSWVSTRRWVIASLTGLIAAMAAFAGTALLLQQNKLLAGQSLLLEEQNEKLREQTQLLSHDVQLAEAARNAELAVEITNIAGLLGQVLDRVEAESDAFQADNPGHQIDEFAQKISVLDPLNDLDQSLVFRIVAASRATRPYRFLQLGLDPENIEDGRREAMARRRHDLPVAYSRMSEFFAWQDPPSENTLVDRPASPERGQLLWLLTQSGIRDYALLNFLGLDLTFAHAPGINLFVCRFPGARLSYADFSQSDVNETDFGGAVLHNARFEGATIINSSFSSVPADAVQPPFATGVYQQPTELNGVDFSNATITDTGFRNAHGLATKFDGAALINPDFTGASLSAATFRDAVLIAPNFDGTVLSSVDFDGAMVFGGDFLAQLSESSLPNTFRPERYELQAIELEQVFENLQIFKAFEFEDVAHLTDGAPAFRIKRLEEFEQTPD